MAFRGITESIVTAREALEAGLFDGPSSWFKDWAYRDIRDTSVLVYVYTVDGMHAGFVYGEPANYQTLEEYVSCADSLFDLLWVRYQAE